MDHHEYQYTVSTVDELMKVNNKEHQTLGMKELKYLVDEHPNDSKLGAEIRKLYWKTRHATDNNPKGTSDYEPEIHYKKEPEVIQYTVFEDEPEEEIDITLAYRSGRTPYF